MQEAFRRYLFVELRFGAAVPGEIVSYMGQILIALWLALRGDLTLETALYAMTVTSAAAAVLQGIQVGFSLRRHAMIRIRTVALEFWRLGGWALANNLCAALRVQFLFWFLAALSGAALPALLQAGFNIVNLLNPLMIGLGNVILQVSSRAHAGGKAEAWRATHTPRSIGDAHRDRVFWRPSWHFPTRCWASSTAPTRPMRTSRPRSGSSPSRPSPRS